MVHLVLSERHAIVAALDEFADDHIKIKTFRQRDRQQLKHMAAEMFAEKPKVEGFLAATFWAKTLGDEQVATAVCKAFNVKGRAADIGTFLYKDRDGTTEQSKSLVRSLSRTPLAPFIGYLRCSTMRYADRGDRAYTRQEAIVSLMVGMAEVAAARWQFAVGDRSHPLWWSPLVGTFREKAAEVMQPFFVNAALPFVWWDGVEPVQDTRDPEWFVKKTPSPGQLYQHGRRHPVALALRGEIRGPGGGSMKPKVRSTGASGDQTGDAVSAEVEGVDRNDPNYGGEGEEGEAGDDSDHTDSAPETVATKKKRKGKGKGKAGASMPRNSVERLIENILTHPLMQLGTPVGGKRTKSKLTEASPAVLWACEYIWNVRAVYFLRFTALLTFYFLHFLPVLHILSQLSRLRSLELQHHTDAMEDRKRNAAKGKKAARDELPPTSWSGVAVDWEPLPTEFTRVVRAETGNIYPSWAVLSSGSSSTVINVDGDEDDPSETTAELVSPHYDTFLDELTLALRRLVGLPVNEDYASYLDEAATSSSSAAWWRRNRREDITQALNTHIKDMQTVHTNPRELARIAMMYGAQNGVTAPTDNDIDAVLQLLLQAPTEARERDSPMHVDEPQAGE